MTVAKKSICASITDHVQLSGFRDVVEVHGKASGSEQAISDFIHDLKMSHPDTIIETREIIDNIPLPEPFSRVVAGDLREISERLDLGVNILSEHTGLFHGIDNKLGGMGDTLNSINTKLGTMGDNFDSFGGKLDNLNNMNNKLDTLADKLDTLPERLAEVLKK